MHHISVRIENDTESDDSNDDFMNCLYEDTGDDEVFMQMWRRTTNQNLENSEDGTDEPLSSINSAYRHIKKAVSNITRAQSIVQNVISPNQNGFATQCLQNLSPAQVEQLEQSTFTPDLQFYVDKKVTLGQYGEMFFKSAESLREEVQSSQQYFQSLSKLSRRFPLKLIKDENDHTQISIDSSYPASTSIIINEGPNCLQWSLSDTSRFSYNSQHFANSDVPSNYLRCFFELMCHELFERIKNDKIKSAIHYSADKDTRSVFFDIGTKETYLFQLSTNQDENDEQYQEPSNVPVWIPSLLELIMDPQAQPATYMRQLLFFKATLDSMMKSFCDRFLNSDFCDISYQSAVCKAAFQINSKYLTIPYLAFIDKWRVSMTETPNELRCIPYSTDGRGLAPALEKWCDISFSTLFLSMAEKVTRSLGFVFKNKNQYGTATINGKKIRFTPLPKSNDVEITITAKNKIIYKWNEIPGSDHIVKMCVLIFRDNYTS